MCNINEHQVLFDGTAPITPIGENIHKLKTWPEFFNAVLDGSKKFEVRKNDRNFQVGDILILKEFYPVEQKYSGRSLAKWISYILPGGNFGFDKDFCVLSIKSLKSCKSEGIYQNNSIICEYWDSFSETCASNKSCHEQVKDLFLNREIPISRNLWAFNKHCPECGRFVKNHEIQSAETGLSYCSKDCAEKHVNDNYIDEWVKNDSIELIADRENKFRESHQVFLEIQGKKAPRNFKNIFFIASKNQSDKNYIDEVE